MDVRGAPKSVLLIASNNKIAEAIKDLLDKQKNNPIRVCLSGSEARRLLLDYHYDMVIINAPLIDELGDDLAIDISSNQEQVVILIVRNEIYIDMYNHLIPYGIIVLERPLHRLTFEHTNDLLDIFINKYRFYLDENKRMQTKLEEMRTIDKAKFMLMENEKMSESEAHRFLEKEAMNLRTTKKVIALGIIKKYNL